MFKKLFFAVAFISLAFVGKSQVELKINPLTIFFGDFDFSLEYGLSPHIGIDIAPTLSFKTRELSNIEYKAIRFGGVVNPRYYFNPGKSISNFYIGVYAKFLTGEYKDGDDNVGWKNTRFAMGPNIGYKIVGKSGILFDIGFGIGNAFYNKNESDVLDLSPLDIFTIDAIGKLAIGYRF